MFLTKLNKFSFFSVSSHCLLGLLVPNQHSPSLKIMIKAGKLDKRRDVMAKEISESPQIIVFQQLSSYINLGIRYCFGNRLTCC